MALTYKKRKFAEYRTLQKMTATAAAEKAGYAHPRKQGSRLNSDPDVLRYIATLEGQTTDTAATGSEARALKAASVAKAHAKPTAATRTTDPRPTPDPTPAARTKHTDPKAVLIELMNDVDPQIRLRAASCLISYIYPKAEAKGKRQQVKDKANDLTTSGKFATLSKQKVH